MNKINFNHTGGFPLETDTLSFMQNAYDVFNSLGEMAGNLAILKGCEITGNSVSDGVVVIGSEVLFFKGGARGASVIIKEEKRSLPFEDGGQKEVEIKRYATFGNGITTYNWSDFFRIKNNQTIQNEVFNDENSLEKRLKKLEEKVTKIVPIGLVAIWDRPADQIPKGWVEHSEMQGFTPVGQKQGDSDFGRLGNTLGEKTHTLTIDEMPKHKHNLLYRTMSLRGGNKDDVMRSISIKKGYNRDGEERTTDYTGQFSGASKPHNNIQPSRIVRFIRFVGW